MTTETQAGTATELPDPETELEHDVRLPVRVRGDVHHYFRRVAGESIQHSKYAPKPRPYEDQVRAYLVETHVVDEAGDRTWLLVYADVDGRPFVCEPWAEPAWRDSGIGHAIVVDEAALEEGATLIDEAERERLVHLVDEHHWTEHGGQRA